MTPVGAVVLILPNVGAAHAADGPLPTALGLGYSSIVILAVAAVHWVSRPLPLIRDRHARVLGRVPTAWRGRCPAHRLRGARPGCRPSYIGNFRFSPGSGKAHLGLPVGAHRCPMWRLTHWLRCARFQHLGLTLRNFIQQPEQGAELVTTPAFEWPPQVDESFVPVDDRYWERAVETMDPAERQKVVLRKLKAQLAYCYAKSDFYKEKWDAAGVQLNSISSLDDLERLPLLRKEELRSEQAENPPFGRYLCVPTESVLRIHGTSGTTGRPTAFGVSRGDWRRIAGTHARIMWAAGVRPTDTIFLGSFFGLYWGGWGALIGGERLGATCFPFGAGVPGQTRQAVEWLAEMRPSAFYSTPSYALRVAEVAREARYDPVDFGIRVLFFSGEPGAGIPATKRLIETTFGGACIDMGSMAEMSPWMTNAECNERTGMHLWDDIVYTELLDPRTEQPVGPGEVGVPVYTHLERESQPMIRLWSGDLSRYTSDPCPCGRTYRRLPDGLFGRADDMLVIRGENVYPAAIEEAIRAAGCDGEFRVEVVRERAMDELKVRAEAVAGYSDDDLEQAVLSQFRKKIGLRANVEIAPAGSLERTEFKSRRISDRRDLSQEVKTLQDLR